MRVCFFNWTHVLLSWLVVLLIHLIDENKKDFYLSILKCNRPKIEPKRRRQFIDPISLRLNFGIDHIFFLLNVIFPMRIFSNRRRFLGGKELIKIVRGENESDNFRFEAIFMRFGSFIDLKIDF